MKKGKDSFYARYVKRILDIMCALAAMLVFSWLYAGVAVLVRVKLGKPVIFRQVRPGMKNENGQEKLFTLYKFRTMTNERDENGDLLPDEVRLTKFGRLLRSTSMDELPEAWNILKGDMSVIGPRPQLVRDMVFMSEKQRRRHDVRPGLSGLAQVRGRNAISWDGKLSTDLEYIEQISFTYDLKIVLQTVGKFLKREDINEEGEATATDLGDYLLAENKVLIAEYETKQNEARRLLRAYQMRIEGWRYYNRAAIPTCAPHETPDLKPIYDGSIWKLDRAPLLARWTTDWDCGYETGWWHCIKDKPFDLDSLKSDKRYKINKGVRYFDVRVIEPLEYSKQMHKVHLAAVNSYPKKNQINTSFENYVAYLKRLSHENNHKIYAAFLKGTDELCGFIVGSFYDSHFCLSSQKADPEYERLQINAALIYSFLTDNSDRLSGGQYCDDGARNINHETNFQEYLRKYFGFRTVYCKLHISYKPLFGLTVKLLFPFRRLLLKFDGNKFVHKINGVLLMESIQRKNKVISHGE